MSEFAKSKTIAEQRRFLPVYGVREEMLQASAWFGIGLFCRSCIVWPFLGWSTVCARRCFRQAFLPDWCCCLWDRVVRYGGSVMLCHPHQSFSWFPDGSAQVIRENQVVVVPVCCFAQQ